MKAVVNSVFTGKLDVLCLLVNSKFCV